jgi:hypothetical protein
LLTCLVSSLGDTPCIAAGIFKQSCNVKIWKYKLTWLLCNISFNLQMTLYMKICSFCWEKMIFEWLIFHVFILLKFWSMIPAKMHECYSHRKSVEDINWWSSGWWRGMWGGWFACWDKMTLYMKYVHFVERKRFSNDWSFTYFYRWNFREWHSERCMDAIDYSHRKSVEDINWWSSRWWRDIWGGWFACWEKYT